MTDIVLFESRATVFARAAELRAEKIRKASLEAELQWQDETKRKKEKAEKKEKEEFEQLKALIATSAEIAAFDSQLDDYDTRTVHALMQNGEALDWVHRDIKQILDSAYVLPDGRRVFKSDDGRRVFDEHGSEISSKVIDPNAIEDRLASWEALKARKDEETRLQTERDGLFAFQAKLDHARERADSGNMTKKEMDEIGADLEASAPRLVREEINPGAAHSQPGGSPRQDQLSGQPVSLIDDPSRLARRLPAPM